MRRFAVLLLAGLLPLGASPLAAQTIHGRALDQKTRSPVDGVALKLMDGDRVVGTAVSDSVGVFTFTVPRAGRFRVGTARLGFADGLTEYFEVPAGENIRIDVPMRIVAVELQPVPVTASRNLYLEQKGFYERTRTAKGSFLTAQQIEKRNPNALTEILRGMSGLRTQRINRKEEIVFSGANCYPQIVLDAVTVRYGGRTTGQTVQPLDDLVNVWHIEAIEAYRGAGDIPIEFEGPNSACGVILIWTRHR